MILRPTARVRKQEQKKLHTHDLFPPPHGVVCQHTYNSKVLGRLRDLVVYTPPGYDQNPSQRYPILYLQHGSGDNQATWIAHGKAHWILDNLIAQGRAVPMVVVMMDGHAAIAGPSGASIWRISYRSYSNRLRWRNNRSGAALPASCCGASIPFG